MPVGFGFSVGDFVSGIQLVRNLIKALQDSGGSSKEYLQLICELRSLETVLIQVKAQYQEVEVPAQRVALHQCVKACEESIDDFLKKITKYHQYLNILGSNSTIRDALRKVQWHLTKSDELGAFRLQIAAHVQAIELLLITIQVSKTALRRRDEGRRDGVSMQVAHRLNGMDRSLELIEDSFGFWRQQMMEQGNVQQQTLASFDCLKQLVSTVLNAQSMNTKQILSAVEQLQESIPPQVLLQKPVIFLDALNRVASIQLDWINSWEAFLAVLEIRFKHIGRAKIQRKEFILQEKTSRRLIGFNRPLEVCLTPGQMLEMSMVFEDAASHGATNSCPHCHAVCDGSMEEEIECDQCHCHFHRIEQKDQRPPISTKYTATGNFTSSKTRTRSKSENKTQEDEVYPKDFKRLRLRLYTISPPGAKWIKTNRLLINPEAKYQRELAYVGIGFGASLVVMNILPSTSFRNGDKFRQPQTANGDVQFKDDVGFEWFDEQYGKSVDELASVPRSLYRRDMHDPWCGLDAGDQDHQVIYIVCNNCGRTITEYYHCDICENGDFDLCQACVDFNITCYGKDHLLIKDQQGGLHETQAPRDEADIDI